MVDLWTRFTWLRALERPRASIEWRDLRVVHPGRAEGPLVGGNLALVEAMAASGRWRTPAGAILALEDVTERPYRVDRIIMQPIIFFGFADPVEIQIGFVPDLKIPGFHFLHAVTFDKMRG